MNLATVRIETDRLLLVPVETRWAPDIFREFTADITRYMFPKPAETIADTLAFVASARAGLARGDNLQLVVLDRVSSTFLGCAGLHRLDTAEPELGLWIKASAHGHGYGRESIQALVAWARVHVACEAFLYPVDKRNAPSCKIPLSLGGVVVREFKSVGQGGQELDEVEYRVPR